MIAPLLAAGLTLVSAANTSSPATSWSCAYVAERLPRSLAILGHDTLSAEDTREARRRLGLSEAVLTRASNLALARSLSATRLIAVRCADEGSNTAIEAQSFPTGRPEAGEVIHLVQPLAELPAAIDRLAQRLSPGAPPRPGSPPPSAATLARLGSALSLADVHERALALTEALDRDPTCLELRLSAVETLIAARDFDAAIRLARTGPGAEAPAVLVRRLRFQSGAALLESGRYAEAKTELESLQRDLETAAVLNNLGVALFRLGVQRASEMFERASLLADHRQRDISFNRTLALLFDGRPDQALPLIDASLQSGPSDVRSRLLRVWALRLLKREAERGEEWERLMAIAPSFSALGNPDIARRLERIFHFERRPGA